MQDVWNRFEAWLRQNWPEGLKSLNPPATDEQIAALEQALGVALPEDYVACLKVHDGQDPAIAGGLLNCSEFLSSDQILDQWSVWKDLLDGGDFEDCESEPVAGIKNDWWNPRWVSFTHDGSGNHLCLDLDPATSGQAGQVITMWHDAAERELLAQNFSAWFAAYVEGVIAGKYVYSDDYDGIVNREDAGLA